MMVDIPQERGMAAAYEIYADKERCRFPLFDSLHIFGPDGIVMCYAFLFISKYDITLLYCSLHYL